MAKTTTNVIIDLRDKLSYDMGHFENAVNIERDVILNHTEFDFPKDVYVYCYKGQCAEVVAEHLRNNGVNATNIGGYDVEDIVSFTKTQQKVKGINKYGDLNITSRRNLVQRIVDPIEECVDTLAYLDVLPRTRIMKFLINIVLKMLKKRHKEVNNA